MRTEPRVPFSVLPFHLPRVRRFAAWPSLLLAACPMAAAGCAGDIAVSSLRAVDQQPFLDQRARLTKVHLLSPVYSGTLAAVVINFPGHRLKAESANMKLEPPVSGTPREVLSAALYPYFFQFFEVRNPKGKRLGYLMAHQKRLAGSYLNRSETLILGGRIPRGAYSD